MHTVQLFLFGSRRLAPPAHTTRTPQPHYNFLASGRQSSTGALLGQSGRRREEAARTTGRHGVQSNDHGASFEAWPAHEAGQSGRRVAKGAQRARAAR